MNKLLAFLLMSCALVSAVVTTGCSSTPAPRFHSLLSTEPAARDAALPPLPLDLAAVGVPPAVDQAQWVVRMPDDSLRILEQEQWVAPLRDELRAALFDGLARRFGAVDVRVQPAKDAWRVKVDVERFESIAGREVWLDAVWSAQPASRNVPPLVCRSSLREPVAGDLTALAAAHRRVVAKLADDIGNRLVALHNGAAARCPG